jgi:cellulose synthase/poly-beta-1,6-N-acetylglucosamine synthase-like glycosyltransferase
MRQYHIPRIIQCRRSRLTLRLPETGRLTVAWKRFRLFLLSGLFILFCRHPWIDRVLAEGRESSRWTQLFAFLAIWKGLKIAVHAYSYIFLTLPNMYFQITNRIYRPSHVTVIIPMVGDIDEKFEEVLERIHANAPRQIIISTWGRKRLTAAKAMLTRLNTKHEDDKIIAISENIRPWKRYLVASAIFRTRTEIIAFADLDVLWPPTLLLQALAPFEDSAVGHVGVPIRVHRDPGNSKMASFWNYIVCMYFEQTNIDSTATYNIDGGVLNIVGYTNLIRTSIVQDIRFGDTPQGAYNADRFKIPLLSYLLNKVGIISNELYTRTMDVDDDNYITRFVFRSGYKTVFHNTPLAAVETQFSAKHVKSFFSPSINRQFLGWSRTSWRHTITSLFVDLVIWSRYPWTTFAMFLSNFSIPIVSDLLLLISVYKSGYPECVLPLFIALYVTKLIPAATRLRATREWEDFWWHLLWAAVGDIYYSAIKIWGFFTMYNYEWTGKCAEVAVKPPPGDNVQINTRGYLPPTPRRVAS